MTIAAGEVRREALRIIRRLIEPEHFMAPLDMKGVGDMKWAGLFGPRNKFQAPVQKVALEVVETLHRADLVVRKASAPKREHLVCEYHLSKVGHAWWRRHMGEGDPYQAQHQLIGTVQIGEGAAGRRDHVVNLGEAPLGWLSRRKGPDGKPFLSAQEVIAGERLRADYTLAQLTARVTADWEGFLAHVDRSSPGGDAADLSDMAMDARARVAKAVQATGPHLSDVLIATCCHLEGLEQAEQSFGWPQRSAKIVLKIALARLALHYGLGMGGAPTRGAHVWHAQGREGAGAGPQEL
ncbi:MAG: DUF6456 domain-containing protein [Parvibaculum sp.]